MLYDSGKFTLSEPKNLNAAQRVEKSTEEFEHCFKSAIHFLQAFEIFVSKGESDLDYYKIAAFKKAYIDARDNKNYKIEKEELKYLGSRVTLLRDLTERICRERIAQFTGS